MMFTRFDIDGGARLSVHSTTKLKTVLVTVYLSGNLDDAVTRRALVPMVLRRGTRTLPDMQAIQRRLEDLYGAVLVSDVAKIGEWHAIVFQLEVVNGAFLPGKIDVVADAVRFLREMIFEPHLAGSCFDVAYVEQEKQNLGRLIESLLDDKAEYALERLVRTLAASEPYRLYEYGDTAELPGIDTAKVTGEWRRCVDRFPMEIYVCGDVDVEATRDLIAGTFSSTSRRGDEVLLGPPQRRPVGEVRHVEERMKVNQGKLCLGFRHGNTYAAGDLEAAVMMNGVLGQFSHSKLFQNVREKASLAYVAHSLLERTKGLLFISCGIAVENYQKTLDICLEQVKAIQDGEITSDELVSTRESLDNHLTMLEDNYARLAGADYVWGLNGQQLDLEAHREAIRAVTTERIVEAARDLELDTVYFLRD